MPNGKYVFGLLKFNLAEILECWCKMHLSKASSLHSPKVIQVRLYLTLRFLAPKVCVSQLLLFLQDTKMILIKVYKEVKIPKLTCFDIITIRF